MGNNVTADMKKRVAALTRDLQDGESVTAAVMRCMGETLLTDENWLGYSQTERERRFVAEMEETLSALNYIVRRLWPAE